MYIPMLVCLYIKFEMKASYLKMHTIYFISNFFDVTEDETKEGEGTEKMDTNWHDMRCWQLFFIHGSISKSCVLGQVLVFLLDIVRGEKWQNRAAIISKTWAMERHCNCSSFWDLYFIIVENISSMHFLYRLLWFFS